MPFLRRSGDAARREHAEAQRRIPAEDDDREGLHERALLHQQPDTAPIGREALGRCRGLSAPPDRVGGMLSVKDKMTLDFERQWWKYAGAKDAAVREQFGESSTRYYQRLNALIDRPDALAYDPLLVRRLLRLRAQRQAARSTARLG